MLRWARILVLLAVSGWRLPAVVAVLFGASWLSVSDVVNTRTGAGWFLDAPANLLSTHGAVLLAVLPTFLLLTGDLVPRAMKSGLAGYAAARLASRPVWWAGTTAAVALLAVLHTALTLGVSLLVGVARLGVVPGPEPARSAMLAEIVLPGWLTEPSPTQAAALVLPLLGALVVIGMVPAVVALWTPSLLLPTLPVAAWLLVSGLGSAPLADVVAAVDAAGYRDYRPPGGDLVVGRSLPVAVAVAVAWIVALAGIGLLRLRRSGIPLRG
jgi:hypothetical protein